MYPPNTSRFGWIVVLVTAAAWTSNHASAATFSLTSAQIEQAQTALADAEAILDKDQGDLDRESMLLDQLRRTFVDKRTALMIVAEASNAIRRLAAIEKNVDSVTTHEFAKAKAALAEAEKLADLKQADQAQVLQIKALHQRLADDQIKAKEITEKAKSLATSFRDLIKKLSSPMAATLGAPKSALMSL